jgi:hypothetical protein
MANAITARTTAWGKILPRSYQLVHDGWRLDVWQFSGVPESWWYWSAIRNGNYVGHGSQYETSDAACDAALKFANLTHSNVEEDCILLYGPS